MKNTKDEKAQSLPEALQKEKEEKRKQRQKIDQFEIKKGFNQGAKIKNVKSVLSYTGSRGT
jgi:hypothetical protein